MPSAHIPRCHFPVVLEHPQGWWLHYSPLLPKQPVHYCWHKSGCCWSSWAYCWLIVSSCRPTLSAPFFSLCSFPATQPQPSHILSCKKIHKDHRVQPLAPPFWFKPEFYQYLGPSSMLAAEDILLNSLHAAGAWLTPAAPPGQVCSLNGHVAPDLKLINPPHAA